MLSQQKAVATVAVRDLVKARAWYEKTLGLTVVDQEGDEALTFQAGGSTLLVYRSQFAGSNRATAVTWMLDGTTLPSLVASLQEKGVAFENYGDLPGLIREGAWYRGDGMSVAWFKDPDGNIMSLVAED